MGQPPSKTLILVFFGCALLMAAGTGWFLAKQSTETPPFDTVAESPPRQVSGKEQVHLYFAGAQGRYLTAEPRVMDLDHNPVRRGRRLVEALFAGPKGSGSRTFPEGSRLRAFFVSTDGTAFVDLDQEPLQRHPGGVETEMLSIYSIVNTLVLNVETIRSVKLLIDGQEAVTLAGHVDLSHAFKADMLWIR